MHIELKRPIFHRPTTTSVRLLYLVAISQHVRAIPYDLSLFHFTIPVVENREQHTYGGVVQLKPQTHTHIHRYTPRRLSACSKTTCCFAFPKTAHWNLVAGWDYLTK